MIQWLIVHLRWWFQDVKLLVTRSLQEFVDDRCTQIAASISYYVFFSIFPLTIFLVTIFGQVLRNEEVKDRVIDALMETLPLVPDGAQEELRAVLDGVSTNLSLLGLLSVVGLIWSASAMMAAIRNSLNIAWDTDHRRPAVRGKLLDILMVLVVGLLIGVSIVATGFRPYVQDILDETIAILGPLGVLLHTLAWLGTIIVPMVVSFLVFSALYRFVPAVRTSFDEIWPGALFAALAFELAKVGFAFYIRNFGNYNAIYGSLGAVIVFMLFIFIAANVLLMGAEIASEWPRIRAGHYDEGVPVRPSSESVPLRAQVRKVLRDAVLGPETAPDHVEDELIDDRSRRQDEIKARQIARLRKSQTSDQQEGNS